MNAWMHETFSTGNLFLVNTLLFVRCLQETSFLCGSTPVSKIREFNQKKKKKMNNSESGFSFGHFTHCPNGPIFMV